MHISQKSRNFAEKFLVMSNAGKIGTFSAISENATIFEILKSNPPSWWTALLRNKDIYVEVRKDNYINMYYEGGCIAKVRYCSKHKKVQAIAHEKYIGIKDGTKYRNIADELDTKVDSILTLIQENYSRKNGNDKEKMSEKLIQSMLITKYPTRYIDSEFAYRLSEKELLRFDLVECDGSGCLTFVELKRIDDSRMLCETEKSPEVIEQMNKYKKFIKQHKDDFLSFYKKLYRIKKSLSLPIPNVEPTSINESPLLLIFNRWEKKHPKRDIHHKRMENILQREKITYQIIDQI